MKYARSKRTSRKSRRKRTTTTLSSLLHACEITSYSTICKIASLRRSSMRCFTVNSPKMNSLSMKRTMHRHSSFWVCGDKQLVRFFSINFILTTHNKQNKAKFKSVSRTKSKEILFLVKDSVNSLYSTMRRVVLHARR